MQVQFIICFCFFLPDAVAQVMRIVGAKGGTGTARSLKATTIHREVADSAEGPTIVQGPYNGLILRKPLQG